MKAPGFLRQSIRAKVVFATIGVFVISIWTLTFYVSAFLHEDMERVLSEQQYSMVSLVAHQVNHEFSERIRTLEQVSRQLTDTMPAGPDAVQQQLERWHDVYERFNGGTFIADINGKVIASIPTNENRIGVNLIGRSDMLRVLHVGETVIGDPVMGNDSHEPLIVVAAPIHDPKGNIVGALAGVINIRQTNFIDRITQNHYGMSGRYLLIVPHLRLIATATDKRRLMEKLPPPGEIALLDRFMQGEEGVGTDFTRYGEQVLAAGKNIPVAGWHITAQLPTKEAYAPIHEMQMRMVLASLAMTLLAGWLIWSLLRRQLAPLDSAAQQLSAMTETTLAPTPLPIVRQDEIGQLIGSFNRLLDTLNQREARLSLSASVFSHAREGITITSADGLIIDVNESFSRITGYRREEVLGQNPRVLKSNHHEADFYVAMWRDLLANDYWHGEIWNRRKSGELYPELLTISVVRDKDGGIQHFVALFTDITPMKEQEEKLRNMAHFDMLTLLPNRVLLADRMQQAMVHSSRRKQPMAVACLDLDGFKAVNDTWGHKAGDQLLVTLANRMKQVLREGDTLARLGGDEFVVVLFDLEAIEASLPVLERLLAAASQPVLIDGIVAQVSASLGVTFYPQSEETDADQLMRQADQAMYEAKLAGKNRYRMFDTEQQRNVRDTHENIEEIRRAMREGELVLHYQPKVNMRTGIVLGAEALIRWQHPKRGLLLPAFFLPGVENHLLAIELGEWVIETALRQVEAWRRQRMAISVSVNVGARQLQHPDFSARLKTILARHPSLSPEDLEIEVLETSALKDLDGISQVIRFSQGFGIKFSLDDFGTGYSSLAYLKRLPVRQIKIDQDFVRNMLGDPDDLTILDGIISLSKAFHRQVIAEGVETIEHGTILLQLGCELAQGYGISPPMPGEQFADWVDNWRPDPAWDGIKPVNRDKLPLLFAIAEHRAWIIDMEKYVAGQQETLPARQEVCRFQRWIDGNGRGKFAGNADFHVLEGLHRQAHAVAEEMLKLNRQQGAVRFEELYAISEEMLARLKALMHA